MTRLATIRSIVALTLGAAAGMTSPACGFGQDTSALVAPYRPTWPRWQGAWATAPPRTTQQTPVAAGDGDVFTLAALGGVAGVAGGVLIGAMICRSGCGDQEYDGATEVLLLAMAGGGLGSTLAGCAAARQSECVSHTLPVAYLGTLAGVGGAVGVGAVTHSGFASLVTYSLIQGLVTAWRIR